MIEAAETQTVEETKAGEPAPALNAIKANYDSLVDLVETKFHFKKVVSKESGVEYKRPTIEVMIPRPSILGIINILEKPDNEKELALLMDAVQDVIMSRARDLVAEDENYTTENMGSFPFKQLTWEAIANLPKAERRGGGISKELWEGFAADYVAVMPGVTGKAVEKVQKAADVFISKFAAVKTDKPVLKLLKDQLALYVNSTNNGDQFADCIEFLQNKANTLLQADSSKLLDNL